MDRAMLLSQAGEYETGGLELVEQWRDRPDCYLWLDLESAPSEDVRQILSSMQCDELAINDSFRARHPPKIEQFKDSTFVLFRGISSLDDSLELEPQQIGLWIGSRHLITYHRGTSISVSHHWDIELQSGLLQQPGVLALKIIHYACGRYLEKLLDFEDQLADLEDGLLSEQSEEGMRKLVIYRSRLRRLKRVFNYHRVMAEQIYRVGSPHLGEGDEGEINHIRRDLYDRCERLSSLCQLYYELCGDLVEGHISLSSHNLNRTMKILTIISALFVPLTFVAGIYGMNFEYMPELGWKYAYFVVIGVMGLIVLAMLAVFRRFRWF
ncbi:metal transporter [Halioglobus maricola]|uniref:Metal transporter n=1 Tax=Halioglobus maricola TaxID=2601894 RepID=A0A5P9NJG2_9GAMM|nr:magnesium transporter CorA family protein [Halioglobus maricola]QFU75108.1 metal transporter [Halioglobus maricola]